MIAYPVLPDALEHSWRGITALIEATAERQVVPCVNGSKVSRSWWTSEDTKEQEDAAKECERCPILAQCSAYGIAHPKESGVYGLTEKQRNQAARADTKAEKGKS